MKVSEAYSLEYNEIIDAEEAYELYSDGVITDKKGFICTGNACEAQITCANIDKEKENMKQFPHFRLYGEHTDSCEMKLEIRTIIMDNEISEEKNYLDNTVIEFLEKRPERPEKQNYKQEQRSCSINLEVKNKLRREYAKERRISKHFTIKSVVDKYLKNIENLENYFFSFKGFKVSFEDIFLELKQQKLDFSLNLKYRRIYYGKGKINRVNKGYMAIFDESFLHNTNEDKSKYEMTSIFIDDDSLSIKMRNKIASLVQEKDIQIFIYGKPTINKEKYINFKYSNADHIDFRIEDIE